jgi:hypothetical protein
MTPVSGTAVSMTVSSPLTGAREPHLGASSKPDSQLSARRIGRG